MIWQNAKIKSSKTFWFEQIYNMFLSKIEVDIWTKRVDFVVWIGVM